MNIDFLVEEKLKLLFEAYDRKESLMTEYRKEYAGGYHTKRTGLLHNLRDTVEFASGVLILGKEMYQKDALLMLDKILSLQDSDRSSRTFGLWSYYLEEDLSHMEAPDYNWADFIGKNLSVLLLKCNDKLPEPLKDRLKQAVAHTAACSVCRNVSPDYTNISLMSCFTILCAGEALQREDLKEEGKKRLEKLWQYTKWNQAFTEYNSSSYALVAIFEITRMLQYLEEEEIKKIAVELNNYAWESLASHYNGDIYQLSPPQARAYRDLDNGSLGWFIYLGTNGSYGYQPNIQWISLESLLLQPKCPSKYRKLFQQGNRFLSQRYYKKNNLRNKEEDCTIIREIDSPDRIAYSYMTKEYSMGIFAVSDCWNQRRNSMVVWGSNAPGYLRVRCMIDGYDFCSGMIYANQYENHIMGILGFSTDRGSFHYILDKNKSGKYPADYLGFWFELGGSGKNALVTREDNFFRIEAEGLAIYLKIHCWIFNGEDGELYFNKKENRIELTGRTEGEIDLNRFKNTYAVYSMTVDKYPNHSIEIIKSEHELEAMIKEPPYLQPYMKIKAPIKPITYKESVEINAKGRTAHAESD